MQLKELQKQESIKRMELLKLRHDVIKCFKEKDEIFKTESGGELQFITDEEAKQIKAFENEYGGMVYHTIKSYTQFSRFLRMVESPPLVDIFVVEIISFRVKPLFFLHNASITFI